MTGQHSIRELSNNELRDAFQHALAALLAAHALIESHLLVDATLYPIQQIYDGLKREIVYRGIHPMIGVPRWAEKGEINTPTNI
ncbi:MAG: hypothetical protein ABI690_19645 [Chloroflexota bacterium]